MCKQTGHKQNDSQVKFVFLEDTFHTNFCKGVFISFEVNLIMMYFLR